MMADKSGSILGVQPRAAQTGTRRANAPADDRMPVCSDPGQASQDHGNSFSAKLQDAAATRRRAANADNEAATNRRAEAAESRQRSHATSADDARPTSGDDAVQHEPAQQDTAQHDPGKYDKPQRDAASAGGDGQAMPSQPQSTDAGSPVTASAASCGTEASPLAAQLLTMLDAAQLAVAPAGAASPLSSAAGAGAGAAAALDAALPTGIAPGSDAMANGLSPSAGKAGQLESYARELERAAALPSPVTGGDQSEARAESGSITSASTTSSSSSASPAIAAALQTLTNNMALHHGPAELAPRSLEASVGSKAWREQLGNQLSWMIDRGEQLATLRLSPEHLGPLEVKIAVRESEATVWFGATQPETRAALEQAMPRLRDMLASQGIALTQSGVSSGSPQDTPRGNAAAARFGATATTAADEPLAEVQRMSNRGLVDLYA